MARGRRPQRRGGARPGADPDRRDDGHRRRRPRHLPGVVGLGAPASAAARGAAPASAMLQNDQPRHRRARIAARVRAAAAGAARTERAEVRYAILHPELGQRWLLTRVEPATLASGKRTTSVVTLDVTEQHISAAAQRAAAARDDDHPREHHRRHRLPARRRAGALQPALRDDAAPAAERGRRLEPGRAARRPSGGGSDRGRDPRGADRRAVYETEFAFTGFDEPALADTPIGAPHDDRDGRADAALVCALGAARRRRARLRRGDRRALRRDPAEAAAGAARVARRRARARWPSARARSSTRCWSASSPSARAASSG